MATKGKVRDILDIIRKDGWIQIKSNNGDHRQFKHPIKAGKVTVDGKSGDDVTAKRWKQMLIQADLR
jgi:predicted RNA binding protein YcfA (HicA-like mRNA interferase family)